MTFLRFWNIYNTLRNQPIVFNVEGKEERTYKSLTSDLGGHSQTTESGIEFWLARVIQHLLGYSEWRNFTKVISKTKTSCEVSDNLIKPFSRHQQNGCNWFGNRKREQDTITRGFYS